ncbi:LLM class flavin-dependent oxidoreductase [Nocardia alni]|uniref:LLM class flavin-dependent oxidoreductase n=1 Tax=Nocardia alni TaxID=2815723 RepID=UPI0027E20309|nr:LLM class flavin-dependent oxidoreductase [Nocardia alni]
MLAQAGGSPAGLAFAASHAELMFLSAYTPEAIAEQVGSVRKLARERGRRDEDVRFLQGLMFIVGATDEEAHRKWRDLEQWRDQDAQTAYFSSLSGLDLGLHDPATPLAELIYKYIARAVRSYSNSPRPAGEQHPMKEQARWMIVSHSTGGSP